MDDGSLQNKGLHLSVYGFTLELLYNFNLQYKQCSYLNLRSNVLYIIIKKDIDYISEKKVCYYLKYVMHKDMLYKITPLKKNN